MRYICLIVVVLLGCQEDDPDTDQPCTKELHLVCGSDGKTYGNPCEAERAGVSWTEGKCPD